MVKNACIVQETLYYHLNMNTLVFHVDTTLWNEKMNLVKFQGKKQNFVDRLDYAQLKLFCICIAVHKIYEVNDMNEILNVLSRIKTGLISKNQLIENFLKYG